MKCPNCGSHTTQTERRPNGNTRCLKCGHEAPTTSFNQKPDRNTKPRIKHIAMQFDFNKDLALYEDPKPNDLSQQYLTGIDLSATVRLENVKLEGRDKYEIVNDLKEAIDKVKEKWS